MILLLRKAIFKGERAHEVELSFSVSEKECAWSVTTTANTTSPVCFFNNYDDALREYTTRIGEIVLGGHILDHQVIRGEIRGRYNTSGYVVRSDGTAGQRMVGDGESPQSPVLLPTGPIRKTPTLKLPKTSDPTVS